MGRIHNLYERALDWRLGIRTREWHQVHDPARPDFRGYAPTNYRDWHVIRRHLKPTRSSIFIDYGAGLGRITVLAARLPYEKVLGVELDPDLVSRAKENIKRAKSRAEMVCTDATGFVVPDNASTFFFCNPFSGAVLAGVLNQIRMSGIRQPRPMWLVCNLPKLSGFEHEIRAVPWLALEREVPLSDERKGLIFVPTHEAADEAERPSAVVADPSRSRSIH